MLIDKDMTKKQLMNETKLSKSTLDKMGRGEDVSLDVLSRICTCLNCGIEDVVEHIK